MYNRKQVFAAACIGLLLFGIMLITLGSILPLLTKKFQLYELSAAKLVSLLPIGILFGSLVFGPIVDRYGYKLLLIFTTLLVVLSFESLAYANSFLLLQVSIFIIGFTGGIINGATNAVVADISSEDKGANLSLLGVSFGIGALGMPLVLSFLLKYFYYSAILSSIGFLMLLAVLYFFLIKFPVPKQPQGFPVKEGVKLLKQSTLLLTAFFLFFQSGAEAIVNNWTTTFLQSHLKLSEKDSLLILSCYMIGLTVSRLFSGYLLKKNSSFAVLSMSLLLTAGSCILLFYANSYTSALVSLVLIGAGLAAGFPVILGYIGHIYANLSGTAFSIALVIAVAGNAIINYSFGIFSHLHGVKQLPVMLGFLIVCGFILLFFIRKKISSKIKI